MSSPDDTMCLYFMVQYSWATGISSYIVTYVMTPAANPRLLAHVGAASTEEAVGLAESAEEPGVDAVGAVPPFFVKPDKESLLNHFRASPRPWSSRSTSITYPGTR